MKRFNKVIHIAVAVDSIANQLREQFAGDNKNADLIAEAVIGCNIHNPHAMGMLVGSMAGWVPELNVNIGEEVTCTVLARKEMSPAEESSEDPITKTVAIGHCTVKDVDPYKANGQVLVEWEELNLVTNGSKSEKVVNVKRELWVDMDTIKSYPKPLI